MSISIRPKGEVKIEGQQGDDQAFEYWVTGDNDYATVMLTCEVNLDLWFNFKYRKGIQLEQQSPGIWVARATYAQLKPDDPKYPEETGQAPIQFELSGEQQHLTQSLETIASYPQSRTGGSGPAPDYKQAVNVSGNGKDRKVEGYDIEFPKFTWSEKYYLPIDVVLSTAYRKALVKAYGKTNKKKFRGYDPKAVRFLGAGGGMSEKFPDYAELTFRFEGAEKADNITIGDITGITKGPFELLWVQYDKKADNNANSVVERPAYVYIERIFDEIDFDTLQLPIPS